MRYTTKQYAETLYDILENTDKSKHKETIALFAKTLLKHKKTGQLKEIMSCFEEISLAKKGMRKILIVTTSEKEADLIAEKFKGALVEKKIDSSILAGAEITDGDMRISSSLKSRFADLKKAIA